MLIPSQIDKSICPLKLVNEYIKVRPLIQGPLFCHYDGSSLSRYPLVSGFPTVIVLNLLDKTMKMKRKRKKNLNKEKILPSQ
jgi:hypothetical protein